MTPSPQILVVDDDRPLRSLLVTILRRHGFSVDAAADGLEALERLQEGRFELMLLDLMMPRMNGYELLAHLAGEGRADIPAIVVLSGAPVDESSAGLVTERVQKPFDVETLIATVRASIARRVAQSATAAFESIETTGPTIH